MRRHAIALLAAAVPLAAGLAPAAARAADRPATTVSAPGGIIDDPRDCHWNVRTGRMTGPSAVRVNGKRAG